MKLKPRTDRGDGGGGKGGKKVLLPQNLLHISYNDET